MKLSFCFHIAAALLLSASPAFSADTSTGGQEPKKTLKERCTAHNVWRRYGSMEECIKEKREADRLHEANMKMLSPITEEQENLLLKNKSSD